MKQYPTTRFNLKPLAQHLPWLLGAVAATGAMAQTTPAAAPGADPEITKLERVEVTVQRRLEDNQDVAASVSAVVLFRRIRNVAALAALLGTGSVLATAPPGDDDLPRVIQAVDAVPGETPFARRMGKKIDDDLIATGDPACIQAAQPGKRPEGKGNEKAKACRVPGMSHAKQYTPNCPDCGVEEVRKEGKLRSHTTRNQVELQYDTPQQSGNKTAWPAMVLNADNLQPRALAIAPAHPDDAVMPVRNRMIIPPDPAQPPVAFSCSAFDGAVGNDATGDCDLSRAAVKKVNAATLQEHGKGNSRKRKGFHANDDGECLAGTPGDKDDAAIPCGAERRVHRITETYTLSCPEGFELLDGRCRSDAPVAVANPAESAKAAIHAKVWAPEGTRSQKAQALMGFTYAPPLVDWGLHDSHEWCIDLIFADFCIPFWRYDIGYHFRLAVGLRLPVEVTVSEIPSPLAVAGEEQYTLKATLVPADFYKQDYLDFCNAHSLGDGDFCAGRFAFPEFFSSQLKRFGIPVRQDGQEFVAQAAVRTGLFFSLFSVPIIHLGINTDLDFATACSVFRLGTDASGNFASLKTGGLSTDEVSAQALLDLLKESNLNCASFGTPMGGRAFPMQEKIHLPANCLNGESVMVLGVPMPHCTGLIIGNPGANFGIGLDIGLGMSSSRIEANWSTQGDARKVGGGAGGALVFGAGGAPVDLGPIRFDNFVHRDAANTAFVDQGTIAIDGFKYCMDQVNFELNANLEFGGFLSIIPDLPSIPILNLQQAIGTCGAHLRQHAGSGPVRVSVPVSNYALALEASPPTRDIKPGSAGSFMVTASNLGSVADEIVLFETPSLPAGWDTTPSSEQLLARRLPLIGHSSAVGSQVMEVAITPWLHFSTAPGLYPITFMAASRNAVQFTRPALDPLGQKRFDATKVVHVNVLPFYEPRLEREPAASRAKPGAPARIYAVDVQNLGNTLDTVTLAVAFADFNAGSCTLVTLGGAGCPFRAVPTIVPASSWTTLSGLRVSYPLAPGAFDRSQTLAVGVPRDWAGMVDTTYVFTLTATSTADPAAVPTPGKASISKAIMQTVVATKQSMTRYIGLQVDELVRRIEAANAAGTKTGGALPIATQNLQAANARALAEILAGDLAGASKTLAAEIHGVAAFVRAINGPSIPAPLVSDWTARAAALTADLGFAQASIVTSN